MKNLTSENCREFIGPASKIVHEWNVHLEIFSGPEVTENCRQYCFSEGDILQTETFVECPWFVT